MLDRRRRDRTLRAQVKHHDQRDGGAARRLGDVRLPALQWNFLIQLTATPQAFTALML